MKISKADNVMVYEKILSWNTPAYKIEIINNILLKTVSFVLSAVYNVYQKVLNLGVYNVNILVKHVFNIIVSNQAIMIYIV